jgi:hypothetical protein
MLPLLAKEGFQSEGIVIPALGAVALVTEDAWATEHA